MSDERPAKLPPCALLVIWACPALTLAESVVWYHDWSLDQGGVDGAYISHASMAQRLGGKVTAGTVSTVRQRLKRLTLHHAIRRRDARNMGWVSTLPRIFVPRTFREAPALAVSLAEHLRALAVWAKNAGTEDVDTIEAGLQGKQMPASNDRAAALGGRGGIHFSESKSEAQLPSAVSKKGDGSLEPERREERDPQEARDEGWALIHLRQGKRLTPEERVLVDRYLARHPERKVSA